MAAINDLISQIQDETLRNRIQEEVSKMAKQKKFGLVFEEHMPESTPLYDMPIKRGCNVMRRDNKDDKSIYVVLKVEGDTAVCVKPEQKDEAVTFELKDIVRVAEFGEPIYPYLKPLDSVCNAPDSDLWHMLIEADNYHALQLLEYLYAGKVDCIYIDPLIILVQRTGNITTTMWMVMMLTVTASGSPSCSGVCSWQRNY